MTYLTTCGAMTLQGPHHVAKQSSTISVPFSPMASSNSCFDCRLCTPSLPMVAEKLRVMDGWFAVRRKIEGVVKVVLWVVVVLL